jgi:hypothetical protein
VSRFLRKCGNLDISERYRLPRPLVGLYLPFNISNKVVSLNRAQNDRAIVRTKLKNLPKEALMAYPDTFFLHLPEETKYNHKTIIP